MAVDSVVLIRHRVLAGPVFPESRVEMSCNF